MGCQCEDLHSWMLMLHLEENTTNVDIISRMSMFQEPEEIFPLVFSLKEEGNKLVKVGNFEKAFIVYTKAVTFLVLGLPCCAQGSHPFRDLAIPLNLNLAMCALKLSKFQWAKCLCDCVLHYEPTNVKALFRRASASLRLGQLKAAKNDLTIAKKVEPKNGDVLKEWNKVNLLLLESTGNNVSFSNCVDMEVDSIAAPTISLGGQSLGFNPLNLSIKNHPNPINQVRSESVGSNLNDSCIDNLDGRKANLASIVVDPPRANKELEDTNPISGSSRPFSKTNLAEPKRFSNHSRPGSILNLSPPDYKRLAAGQVLRFHHPHLIGFMSVRVKRFASNPNSVAETHEVESPSATFPEMKAHVGDNVICTLPSQSVTASDVIDIIPTPMRTISQAPSTVLITPNNVYKPLSRRKVTSSTGMGTSRLVRRHAYGPSFNSRVVKCQSKHSIKRVSKSRHHPTLGMKRKCMSNTFILSYPAWKKRVLYNRNENLRSMTDCDQKPTHPFPYNNTLHQADKDPMTSTMKSFKNIVMNKLNISL